MKLILASNSPRRRELLSQLNYNYDVIPSDCDETTNAESPIGMVKEIALRKALNVYKRHGDCCVIGCDTVVDLDGRVLGKPHSAAEAATMLKSLSGRNHKVHTGVCILCKSSVFLFTDTSTVSFDELTDERIEKYIGTGSPFDKAGAYGVQDSGFVTEIVGSYRNVMGFPSDKIDAILKRLDLD